jgi:hypothetical protein
MGRMKAAYDAGKDASAGGGGGVSSSSSSGVKRPQLPSASPAKKKKN